MARKPYARRYKDVIMHNANDIIICETADAVGAVAAERLFQAAVATLRESAVFSLALTGGESPRGTFACLLRDYGDRFPWMRTHVYWGDERCVPPDDVQSNYRLARELLLDQVPISADHIHRMSGEADPEQAAVEYARLLPAHLDLLLLGIGPDGHICSLFPGHPALHERERRVVPVYDSPKPPPRRLTITPPVIEAARNVIVLALGEAKAEAAARALQGTESPDTLPAALVKGATWLLDRAGAKRL